MRMSQCVRASRGVRLADEPKRVVTLADCGTAFQAAARDCLSAMEVQHLGTVAGDTEALHQMRVAISRFRAIVAFFKPMTFDTAWPKLKKELAWVNARLGQARDADVMAALAQRKRYRKWALHGRVNDTWNRDRLYRRAVATLRSSRFRQLMDALSRWVECGPWQTRRDDNAQRRRERFLELYSREKLERWRRRLIRKGRRLSDMGSHRRHCLRIKTKRYRYVLEILGDLFPPGARKRLYRLLRSAKRVQRTLGDLRDLQRLRRLASPSLRPPGYRKQKERLLAATRGALHELAPPLLLPRL
jgi:CHAD domain-containing protein